jgi:hypothetical protein
MEYLIRRQYRVLICKSSTFLTCIGEIIYSVILQVNIRSWRTMASSLRKYSLSSYVFYYYSTDWGIIHTKIWHVLQQLEYCRFWHTIKLQIAMSPECWACDSFLWDLCYILDCLVCFSHVPVIKVFDEQPPLTSALWEWSKEGSPPNLLWGCCMECQSTWSFGWLGGNQALGSFHLLYIFVSPKSAEVN